MTRFYKGPLPGSAKKFMCIPPLCTQILCFKFKISVLSHASISGAQGGYRVLLKDTLVVKQINRRDVRKGSFHTTGAKC